jgi:hypothetical protein
MANLKDKTITSTLKSKSIQVETELELALCIDGIKELMDEGLAPVVQLLWITLEEEPVQ